jgi:probable F420-dependent oxidoreductase
VTGVNLPPVGLWTHALDLVEPAAATDLVRELESLGYGALWLPEAVGRDPLIGAALALSATERLVAGTSIASIYARGPLAMNAAWRTLESAFPGRFVLGLGVSHEPMVAGMHKQTYEKPLGAMRTYLDRMDAAPFFGNTGGEITPTRLIAALGPKMLALSAERADGACPYNVTPEHTKLARDILGPDKLLVVEQKVMLTTDIEQARAVARQVLGVYLGLPNYANNWKRLGFTDDDLAAPGSDRLCDAMVASGNEAAIRAKVQEHRDAGADHVAVQVLGADAYGGIPADDWRRLAPALLG